MKGSICNTPVTEVDVNCNMLLRQPDKDKIYLNQLGQLQVFNSLNSLEVEIELSSDEEIQKDPLSGFRAPSVETAITSETLSTFQLEQEIVIAPGESKQPGSVLNNKFCEELTHPYLCFTGKYGYQIEREIPLSPRKYFNQRLQTNICSRQ